MLPFSNLELTFVLTVVMTSSIFGNSEKLFERFSINYLTQTHICHFVRHENYVENKVHAKCLCASFMGHRASSAYVFTRGFSISMIWLSKDANAVQKGVTSSYHEISSFGTFNPL